MRAVVVSAIISLAIVNGCMAGAHRAAVRDDTGDRLTVGTVQREIRIGMTGAQVVEVLGAPNVVSTDEQRREVWVYDKIATESVSSSSSGIGGALIFGGSGGAGGIGGGGSGASSTTQRTLTVIIKFDEQGKVRDFGYRQSSF